METITGAIAVLGVYFALMAVLAVAVEAILGWLKVPWTRLQGKPSPEAVLNEVQVWLSPDEAKAQETRLFALNKALKTIGETEIGEDRKGEDFAKLVGEATTKYVESERKRRALIRAIAIVLGILVAALFQVNTVELLAPIFGEAQIQLQRALGADYVNIVGIALSGLAASAGSSFWHDQSARLRSVKSASESVARLKPS